MHTHTYTKAHCVDLQCRWCQDDNKDTLFNCFHEDVRKQECTDSDTRQVTKSQMSVKKTNLYMNTIVQIVTVKESYYYLIMEGPIQALLTNSLLFSEKASCTQSRPTALSMLLLTQSAHCRHTATSDVVPDRAYWDSNETQNNCK